MVNEAWREPLGQTWAALDREAGTGPVWSGELEVTGRAGRLRSRLPAEDVAIACAGVALLAAAALHAGRGGPVLRTLRLDRGHVAATFRSEAWLRVNGEPAGAGFAPLPLGQWDGLELAWPSPLTRYGSDPPAWG
jgi:hypothetical protein